MSAEEEMERKRPLSKEEYSVLVLSVCFAVVVLLAFGIAAYKVVCLCLHAG